MHRYTLSALLPFVAGFILLLPDKMVAQTPAAPDTLHGIISDGTTDEPVPGARVALLGFTDDGTAFETGEGAVTDKEGYFSIQITDSARHALRITSLGFRTRQITILSTEKQLGISLYPEIDETPDPLATLSVKAERRSRSVEDGCCRVESIREEVQQHAPFSPSPVESLRRYSSCTSGRVINAIDDAGTISLRGLEPTRVGLLLDGAPLFSGYSRFYGLGIIPSHALQTIQITEGASDTRYGNGAISGVVNLQTRLPTEEAELNGSIALLGESANPDQIDVNLGYTGLVGQVGVGAFGSYNNHQVQVSDHDGTLDREYERGSAILKANVLLDNVTEATATILGGTENRTGLVTTEGSEDYRHTLNLDRLDGILTISRLFGDNNEILGTGAISHIETAGSAGGISLNGGQTILYGEARLSGSRNDHSYAMGVQVRNDDLTDDATPLLNYSTTTLGFYAQDAVAFGERWTAQIGGRIDHHSSAGLNLAPRGSLRFAPGDNTTMRLMVGGGFKGDAEFDEEYRILTGAYLWLPNPDIAYERSWTVNYDISHDALFGDNFGVNTNFNAYYTVIDGRHTPQPDSLANGVFHPVNDDDPARLMGIEAQARWTLGSGWSGSLALSLIDYTVLDQAGKRQQVPLAPRINLDASIMYRHESSGWLAEAWSSRIGEQTLPVAIDGRTESVAYTILNARVEKSFGPVAVFLGLLNALDARQVETMPLIQRSGEIPNGGITWGLAEGREFFAGIRARIL